MSIQLLLDDLEEVLDSAWNMPLTNKAVVDAENIRIILEDIKNQLPQEIRQARKITSDRNKIINSAKDESDVIIQVARNKAKALVQKEEIVKDAKIKANEILGEAQAKSKQIKKATNEYVDDIMKKTEEKMLQCVNDFKQSRRDIRSTLVR